MAGIYFIVIITLGSIAFVIGLISSLAIMPDETAHEQIYFLAVKIAVAAMFLMALLFCLFKKTGHIKIEETIIREGEPDGKDQ